MIHLGFENAFSPPLPAAHGVTGDDRARIGQRVGAAHRAVVAAARAGKLGYAALPTRTDYADQVAECVRRRGPATSDLVILGIGGSALGSIALHTALHPATYKLLPDGRRGGPRLFVLHNVDPALVADTLALLDDRLDTTVFHVISKSGRTAETLGQFLIVRDRLRRRLGARHADRFVVTTDEPSGDPEEEANPLRDLATAAGYEMILMPRDVGGRFSVLSPVGLLSAAMCGGDIGALLGGAAAMAQRVADEADWQRNPACCLAAVAYLMMDAKGKPIHVMMPYSNRLAGLADWYRQLWAESLGKRTTRDGREAFVGPTPVKALGATDQHSQMQLYREGPNDKWVVFLETARHPADAAIPDAAGEADPLPYVGGIAMADLLRHEKRATEYALLAADRPSVTIRFDAVDAESVGAFVYLFEFVTSLMGELLDIDAYNQEGVELGKHATFALLGHPGRAELKDQVGRMGGKDQADFI